MFEDYKDNVVDQVLSVDFACPESYFRFVLAFEYSALGVLDEGKSRKELLTHYIITCCFHFLQH